MIEALTLDYYYGNEAEQFAFYRVPRLLFKDERYRELSSDAKLLYGLMLDRMGLSMRNGWTDDENRAYIIYTIEQIAEDLNCGRDKAIHVLSELDSKKGIGLIEKQRRGLGKPDVIYVKNFTSGGNAGSTHGEAGQSAAIEKTAECPENPYNYTEVGKADFKKSEKPTSRNLESRLQQVGKTDFKKSEKPTSASRENRLQEVGNSDAIYTDMNYTDVNQTERNQTEEMQVSPSVRLSGELSGSGSVIMLTEEKKGGQTDGWDHACEKKIRENIGYDHYMTYARYGDKELFDEMYQILCETACIRRKTVKIEQTEYPYDYVREKLLSLDNGHLVYVMGQVSGEMKKRKIVNMKRYLLTALFNSTKTINHYYQQEVQQDMYGG